MEGRWRVTTVSDLRRTRQIRTSATDWRRLVDRLENGPVITSLSWTTMNEWSEKSSGSTLMTGAAWPVWTSEEDIELVIGILSYRTANEVVQTETLSKKVTSQAVWALTTDGVAATTLGDSKESCHVSAVAKISNDSSVISCDTTVEFLQSDRTLRTPTFSEMIFNFQAVDVEEGTRSLTMTSWVRLRSMKDGLDVRSQCWPTLHSTYLVIITRAAKNALCHK